MDIRKETLKLARNLIEKDPTLKDWVIGKFPELRESEDKKMMKAVLQFTKENVYARTNYQGETIGKKEMVDWLEKRIKAIDGSQPKFKVGDCWSAGTPILKFKEGDRINLIGREEADYTILTVTSVNMDEKCYTCHQGTVIDFDKQGDWYVVNPKSGWWGEYDELIMRIAKKIVSENGDCSEGTANKILEWLETVKKRVSSPWRPTQEQMEALEYYMAALANNNHREELYKLYKHLSSFNNVKRINIPQELAESISQMK